jgi:hypothetical protein
VSPQDVQIEVRRQGRTFDAQAECELDADAATVWGTITDYESLPAFMPGIRSSRVLERVSTGREGERLVLEQRGEFRFLLFRQLLTVRLLVTHEKRRIAHARAEKFELGVLRARAIDAFDGRYELVRAGRRVRLLYRSRIVSRFAPPPGIGTVAVRQNLGVQLAAVIAEVARRST